MTGSDSFQALPDGFRGDEFSNKGHERRRFRRSAMETKAPPSTSLLHIGEAMGVVLPYGCLVW